MPHVFNTAFVANLYLMKKFKDIDKYKVGGSEVWFL